MRARRLALGVLVVSMALVIVAGGSTVATAQDSSFAVTISPVKIEMRAKPGQVVTQTVDVTNGGTSPVELQSSASDFVAQGEGGKPQFVPAEQSPWSMSNWISTDPATFTLKPGEKRSVSVKIAIPKKAEPGGHYSAVLFSSAPSASGQTAVVAKVGTLILMAVDGKIKNAGTLKLSAPRIVERGPIAMTVRFSNQGNVHVVPKGSIVVRGLGRSQVASIPVGGENVLPDSTRAFTAKWTNVPVGIYRVRANALYGNEDDQAMTGTRLLFVLPWKTLLIGVAIFALGIVTAILIMRRRPKHSDA